MPLIARAIKFNYINNQNLIIMYSTLVENLIKEFNKHELVLTQDLNYKTEILGVCHLDDLEHKIQGLQIVNELKCPDSTLYLVSNYVDVRLKNPNAALDTNLMHWHPILITIDLDDISELSSLFEGIWNAIDYPNAD